MPISPELRRKIDELENANLRERILDMLTSPGKRLATDEEIFESMVSRHVAAEEQRARLRKWKDAEVIAFAKYFQENRPEDYIEFLRQEKEFREIEAVLAWNVRRLILNWIPNLDESDVTGLFGKFRDYAESHLI